MNCGFFLTTLTTAVFGLILDGETYTHTTAKFGLQSNDPAYERSAHIVTLKPATGCYEEVENQHELEGAIVLTEVGGCKFVDKARTVEGCNGTGLVVGNIYDTLVWMQSSTPVTIGIPCVFVTRSTYVVALESFIATISKAGEVAPPKLWTFPELMQIVTCLLIIFPVVWAILGLKYF